MGQKSRRGFLHQVLWLRVSCKAALWGHPELQSSQGLPEEGSASGLTDVAAGCCSSLAIGPRASCWLLAGGRPHFLVTGASPEGSSQHGSLFCKKEQGRRTKESVKTDVTVFSYLTLEVTSHHICRIPFIKSQSSRSAHTQGKDVALGHEYQKVGISVPFLFSTVMMDHNPFQNWEMCWGSPGWPPGPMIYWKDLQDSVYSSTMNCGSWRISKRKNCLGQSPEKTTPGCCARCCL